MGVTSMNVEMGPALDEVTVDELARRAGATTRNIRALQTLGLLPGPRVQGRTGYYGEEHRRRLTTVLRLQGDGFSLGSIARLFEARDAGMTLDDVLGSSVPPVADRGDGAGGLETEAGADADDADEADAFDSWSSPRRGRLLWVVPSTMLSDLAS